MLRNVVYTTKYLIIDKLNYQKYVPIEFQENILFNYSNFTFLFQMLLYEK